MAEMNNKKDNIDPNHKSGSNLVWHAEVNMGKALHV